MVLAFESKRLRAICESEAEAQIELGTTVANSLKGRLADLYVATSYEELIAGSPRVCEHGHLVIDLSDGYRIVLSCNHVKQPMNVSNHLDWSKVNRVKVLSIDREHE